MPQLSGPSHRSCRTRVAPSRATERPKPRMTNVYPQSLFPRARRIREDFQLDFSSYRGESARNLSHARSVPPTQCGRSAFVRPLTSVGTTTRPRSSPRPAQGPGAVRHPGAAQGHAAPVLPLSDQRWQTAQILQAFCSLCRRAGLTARRRAASAGRVHRSRSRRGAQAGAKGEPVPNHFPGVPLERGALHYPTKNQLAALNEITIRGPDPAIVWRVMEKLAWNRNAGISRASPTF